jgi:hypothetical protein
MQAGSFVPSPVPGAGATHSIDDALGAPEIKKV